ncbi:hypothetical protein PROVRETT_10112 [Providencia rettgeri DSM 1131]|nr:hypothetical protein PROVRETT_10112 [Providencia rettgeri DSM 1131]
MLFLIFNYKWLESDHQQRGFALERLHWLWQSIGTDSITQYVYKQ